MGHYLYFLQQSSPAFSIAHRKLSSTYLSYQPIRNIKLQLRYDLAYQHDVHIFMCYYHSSAHFVIVYSYHTHAIFSLSTTSSFLHYTTLHPLTFHSTHMHTHTHPFYTADLWVYLIKPLPPPLQPR